MRELKSLNRVMVEPPTLKFCFSSNMLKGMVSAAEAVMV
jgi:hypothetical protein